jgi:hypothetical protein
MVRMMAELTQRSYHVALLTTSFASMEEVERATPDVLQGMSSDRDDFTRREYS